MSKAEPVTYELFAEHGNTDRFLKRLKNEVDYYNNTKQPAVPMSCWVGWNNFEIEYTGDFTMPAYEFLLPRTYPTKMKGWITEEDNGIRIRYSFEKVARFKKWILFMSVYAGILLGLAWLGMLGDWLAQIGKADVRGLLISLLSILLTLGPFTALSVFCLWRGGAIPKGHRTAMEKILKSATWEG